MENALLVTIGIELAIIIVLLIRLISITGKGPTIKMSDLKKPSGYVTGSGSKPIR